MKIMNQESRKAGKRSKSDPPKTDFREMSLDELIRFCEFWELQIPQMAHENSQLQLQIEELQWKIWKLEAQQAPDKFTEAQIAARSLAQMREAAIEIRRKRRKRARR